MGPTGNLVVNLGKCKELRSNKLKTEIREMGTIIS